jgi:hypothetical protein
MRCAHWAAVLAIGCGAARAPESTQAAVPVPLLTVAPAATAPTAEPARPVDSRSLLPDPGEPAAAPATARAVPAGPRVGGTQWFTWIYSKPDTRTMPLGYLRPGSTLALADPATIAGHGCMKFVRVSGGGFVCASRAGTLDTTSRYFEVGRAVEPAPGAFPYEYALSVGTHMFTRVPTPEEYTSFKNGDRDRPLRGWEETHDELATPEPIAANGPIPEFLRDGGSIPSAWGKQQGLYFKRAPRGVMIAYTRAFEAHGEIWVLATNLTVVPALGLKRYRRTSFHGLALGGGVDLPIAWVKSGEPVKWRLQGGQLTKTNEHWGLRSYIALTGAAREEQGVRFLETKEPDTFVSEREVAVARRRKPPRLASQPDEKWVHSELGKGLLTLYRGERPVFVTLASPGVENATPAGLERVESKHHVSTLTTENGEPKKFWIADAPWVVYFKRPFAIHSAFWHEDFGVPRSYGCINVSPQDGQTIFDFVDPPLPAGWGSAQGHTRLGRGTWILVER